MAQYQYIVIKELKHGVVRKNQIRKPRTSFYAEYMVGVRNNPKKRRSPMVSQRMAIGLDLYFARQAGLQMSTKIGLSVLVAYYPVSVAL